MREQGKLFVVASVAVKRDINAQDVGSKGQLAIGSAEIFMFGR